jgi:ABC-type enterobactin transport system permease subunit
MRAITAAIVALLGIVAAKLDLSVTDTQLEAIATGILTAAAVIYATYAKPPTKHLPKDPQ